jgi:hypothetical protein
MVMPGGKDEATMAVPGERVRLLQHSHESICAFVLQFGAFQKAFEGCRAVVMWS